MLEDGTPLESDAEEDEAAASAEAPADAPVTAAPLVELEEPPPTAPAPAAAAPAAPEPPAAQTPSAPPAGPDAATLTKSLTDLVRRMIPVIAANPDQQGTLKGLAAGAQTALKGGDLQTAATTIDHLRDTLDRAPRRRPVRQRLPRRRVRPRPLRPTARAPPPSPRLASPGWRRARKWRARSTSCTPK